MDAIVTIEQGQVRGARREGSTAYLGIPFAEPPVGKLRFAAPRPAHAWDGVRQATTYGATPQRRPFAEVTAIPEPSIPGDSTLNVNVFTPRTGHEPEGEPLLPVLVWIHGGGYKAGSPASPWYDGRNFNRDGVVTVTLSYRLGFEGFGAIEGAPDNRGLLDQIEALRWVQRNIEAFGGDPAKVTIAGQSAGGGSVLALLTSPPADGLFRAAIAESPALRAPTLERARGHAREMAALLGVEPTVEGFSTRSEDEVLDAQAQLEAGLSAEPSSPEALLDTMVATGGVDLAFLPYLDGEVLPGQVADGIVAGRGSGVPLLLGTTAHEFTFVGQFLAPQLGDADVEPLLREHVLGDLTDEFAQLAPDRSNASLLGQLMTELTFRTPTARWAELRGDAPTWLYDYRHRNDDGLAPHCAEVPFVFDCLGAELVQTSAGSHPPQALADAVHGVWVRLITHAMLTEPTAATGRGLVFGDPDTDDELSVAEVYAFERRLATHLTDSSSS